MINLQKKKESDRYNFKITLLGNSGVGKTSFTRRFIYDSFDQSDSTIGAVFLQYRKKINDKDYYFQIWDTAGQERYRSITPIYYRNTNAVLLFYDVTDQNSLEDLQYWIDVVNMDCNKSDVILMIGNKCDKGAISAIVKQGEKIARDNNYVHFVASAKTCINVNEPFRYIENLLTDELDESSNKYLTEKRFKPSERAERFYDS